MPARTLWGTIRQMQTEIDALKASVGTGLSGTDQTIKGSHDRLDTLMGAGLTAVPSCILYHNAATAIATGWQNFPAFNVELRDTDTMHDPGVNPGRITFTRAGLYSYGYSIAWDAAVGLRQALVLANGATSLFPFTSQYVAAANIIYLSSAGIYPFTAGQYIELRVNNGTGGALNILNWAYTTPIFWAAKIG